MALCERCQHRGLKLQPVYRLGELAAMAELSRWQLRRLLDTHDVQLKRCGRIWLVPLSEIEEKLSWLRKSMQVRDMHEQIASIGAN